MIIKGEKVLYELAWIGFAGVSDGNHITYSPRFSFEVNSHTLYECYCGFIVGQPKQRLVSLAIL